MPEYWRTPLKVSEENLVQIFDLIYANPSAAFEINLEAQLLIIAEKNKEISFEIDAYKKNNLMNGFDDIDYLISIKDEIVSFSEKNKILNYSNESTCSITTW